LYKADKAMQTLIYLEIAADYADYAIDPLNPRNPWRRSYVPARATV